ncbi:MAG: hypothetical protein D6798_00800 [Deltaproteobacteria bacterium]|nr:MAG: hypothetical protein D6798_00800 [Deltaproteobacteria bacterium]
MRHRGIVGMFVVTALTAAACGSDGGAAVPAAEIALHREPTIVMPAELTVVDADEDGVERVVVDASATADPDGDTLSFRWTSGLDEIARGAVLDRLLPVGDNVLTLTATDGEGLSDVASIVVHVVSAYDREPGGPEIALWGGFEMNAGVGRAQRWFDVPGRVTDPDGIGSLTVSLNGQDLRELAVGPNGRRLVAPGDFNADLARDRLRPGDNVVTIRALDLAGAATTASIRVHNDDDPVPQPPLEVDWRRQELDGLVEIVDGRWTRDGDRVAIEPDSLGYDRLLAIGDRSWSDYEVDTDVIVDRVAEHLGPFSNAPGFGLLLRWNGHNDSVAPGQQPKAGFRPDQGLTPTPLGAFLLYQFLPDGTGVLQFQNHRTVEVARDTSVQVEPGRRYRIRARVVSGPAGATYTAKLWPADAEEPEDWMVTYEAGTTDFEPASGSLVLLTHETAASFGPVRITGP